MLRLVSVKACIGANFHLIIFNKVLTKYSFIINNHPRPELELKVHVGVGVGGVLGC